MTAEQKAEFIKELAATMVEEATKNIAKMPEDWNGFELRWYLAEKLASNAYPIHTAGLKARHKKYKNTVLVNNL
jgi:hypothetical protein